MHTGGLQIEAHVVMLRADDGDIRLQSCSPSGAPVFPRAANDAAVAHVHRFEPAPERDGRGLEAPTMVKHSDQARSRAVPRAAAAGALAVKLARPEAALSGPCVEKRTGLGLTKPSQHTAPDRKRTIDDVLALAIDA